MPRRPKKPTDDLAPIPDALLEPLVGTELMTADQINAATKRFKKALIERALGAELTHHLGYPPGGTQTEGPPNERNGISAKTVLTDDGALTLAIPRDRAGTFAPQLIPRHERRFSGFDDAILALYARGMTVRDIQTWVRETYAVDVSPDLISTVTEAVTDEITTWQSRPLEPMYPVVFFDALRVKVRQDGVVVTKAVYVALAVLSDGSRDILGLWVEQTEGAKFWMKVFAELQARGCQDILIAVTDGLTGMPDALAAVFPRTTLQTCIVHLIRHSLEYAGWRDRKSLAAALRTIYTAASADAAAAALDTFADSPLGQRFPPVVAAWRRAWDRVIPFFAFPPAVRRIVYTTNALENVNRQLRKSVKTRGHFPSDDAALKLLYLSIRRIVQPWAGRHTGWPEAMTHFAILYGDRFTQQLQ